MIVLDGVTKRFGDRTVLKGVDLAVARGEVLCLIGGSGSGKSTILRCINGLERHDAGTITVGGIRVDDQGFRAMDDDCARQLLGADFTADTRTNGYSVKLVPNFL